MSTLFFEHALLPTGWASNVRITVAGRMIAAVERDTTPAPADQRHAIGLPGVANLHSHGFQRGMAGLSEIRGPGADSFWTWREVMYRFLAVLSPDDVEAITAQAYLEMLEGGFTRVGEFHYLHHDHDGRPYADIAEMAARVVAAADTTGMGMTLLPCFYAHGGFGGVPPAAGQRRFVNTLDDFGSLLEASGRIIETLPGAVLGIAPHSLRAVTEPELGALLTMAPMGPVHMHVAEQVREVEDCVAHSGARPVAWLLDHAAVDERWCLIHATHMDTYEARRLAQTGAVAGLCPVTEANLGDGIFPGETWTGRYGIGTDSNVLIGVAAELRQLEYAQRLGRQGRNLMAEAWPGASTGRSLFQHAVMDGAAALGAIAGLQPGASADLVTLRAEAPSLCSHQGDGWLDGWIFGASEGVVDCVWAGGRLLVEGGRHVRQNEIARRYRSTLARVLAA